jgi:hypothetical protein
MHCPTECQLKLQALVKDVQHIQNLNWCSLVLNNLMHQIIQYKEKKRQSARKSIFAAGIKFSSNLGSRKYVIIYESNIFNSMQIWF